VGSARLAGTGADERFLVVREDLAVPIDLLRQNRLDGLWNEEFKRMVRYAIMGQNDEKGAEFRVDGAQTDRLPSAWLC
jgi:pullulanase